MPLYVADLLQVQDLGLVPLTSACRTTGRQISWVSTTELEDPRQFLRGDEVVLTTGLHNQSPEQQRAFVVNLVAVPVAALGFATGLVNERVPAAVIEEAERAGLALFEIPITTPFIAISHWVAERLFAEKYEWVRQVTLAQDALTRALLDGLGLGSLVRKLRGLLGVPVAVIDRQGRVLDSRPARAGWPALAELRVLAAGEAGPVTVSSVDIEGVTVGYLCAAQPPGSTPIIPFAVGLIGLELARRQAILTGRRELLGQVIQDLVFEHVAVEEATRRLAVHGFKDGDRHRLLLGQVTCSPERLRRVPWNVLELVSDAGDGADAVLTGLVEDLVVLVAPDGRDHAALAAELLAMLARLGADASVGVSGVHQGVRGLRIGFFEARQAVGQGPGLQDIAPLSLAGLLLNNSDAPVRDMALISLQPILDHDANRKGDLLETLRVFLDSGCSPGESARRLVIHRNGLQYRLQRIEKLTGRDLSSFDDRIHLWLALRALEMS
ncbi:PucR family transcriptional regulator [Streptosporangium sp. NPDC004631]